jgi:regulator of protease activity HflC (stomatin/prohibitin superfamily)
MVLVVLVLMVMVAVALAMSLKIASEHERAVIFRLGRLVPEPKGPGVFLVIPIIDRVIRVNLLKETLAEAVHAEEAVGMEGVVQDEETVLLNRGAPWPARSVDATPLVPGRAVVVESVDDDLRVVVRSEAPDRSL